MIPAQALIDAAERAQLLLRGLTVGAVMERGIEAINAAGLNPYCVNEGRASGQERISTDWLDAAIAAAKAAEEEVETKYRLEWYSNVSDSWVPDFHIDRDKDLIDKRMDECTAGTNKLRMIQKDTYTTVIEVREKEGLRG